MKKVLAITVALMIAAIVLMPALGYTNQAAGNQFYTAKSGDKVDSSFTTKVPAHNLTPEIQASKYSFKSASVQSTRMTYSFKQGTATPYSFKQPAVENAVMLGMMNKKPVTKLGSMNKMEEAAPVVEPVAAPVSETITAPVSETITAPVNETITAPVNETITAPVNETIAAPVNETITAPVNETIAAPVNETIAALVAEPKFTIEGMVVDANQTGLAGWTINLTENGTVINNSVPTAADGKFVFADLAAGEYTVSEALMQGWSIISPAEGKSVVTIANASVTDLVFVNQLVTSPANDTALGNATAAINATG
jgi:hypothetical protein